MKKKFILITLFSFTLSYANIVNWVVALVNNEPITNNEVHTVMKKININEKDAIEFLIKEKLKISEIKNQGILVSPFEIDTHIENIAKNNNKTINEFKKDLAKAGVNYNDFKNDIAENIKEQKLFESIFATVNQSINPDNVKAFYEQNKNLFTTFEAVKVTRFASDKESIIKNIANGGNIGNTFNHKLTIKKSQLDPKSAYVFLSIPNGKFTPILHNPKGYYEVFRIDSKVGYKTLSFEEVEKEVTNQYVGQLRRKNVEEYFEKLRTQAVIEFIPSKNQLNLK